MCASNPTRRTSIPSAGRAWFDFKMGITCGTLLEPIASHTDHHAKSPDGRNWQRSANSSIARSDQGWDSDMTCYANVIDVKGRRLMFYNGNGHGRSGFGVAVMED